MKGPLLVLLAAALATLPMAIRGVSCGHDFDFHLVSWIDCLHSWKQGMFYPQWAPSPNFGAGEPRFVFYPPLTWMVGAALGALMSWHAVPIVLAFLLLAGTGWATRALAHLAMSDSAATLAGCLAIFSGYALFTTYERAAYAELAGGFWIPLMLLLVLRQNDGQETLAPRRPWHAALDGSAVLLALVVAGAWLSNAPVGVMASYLLAAFAVAVAALSRSWVPVLRAATGAALGLGLAAFYLVPAAWEQKWVAIRQATDDPGLLIENSFLFAKHANPALELHDIELLRVSCIGITMIALALLGLLVSWKRGRLRGSRRIWVPLAIIPVVILLLQLPLSLPVWNALPKLRFLQFPWRWLVALEAPMSIFIANAVWAGSRRWRLVVASTCVVFCLGATTIAHVFLFQGCDADDSVRGMLAAYRSGTGFEGTDEYAPPRADNTMVATDLPGACLVSDRETTLGAGDPDLEPQWSADQHSCEATFALTTAGSRRGAEERRVQGAIPHAGYLVLRLRTYPAWAVRVNGQAVEMPARQDGLMAVPVPAGPVVVTADWTTTRDRRIGGWISLVALLVTMGLGSRAYRRRAAHLS